MDNAEDSRVLQAVLNLLKTKGPNAMDPNGNTPLIWAARNGKLNVVKFLIEQYQLPLNVQNFNAETALSVAVVEGYYEIAKFLIESGASINLGNCRSESPLHLAVVLGNLDVARLLVEEGAHVDAEDDCGDTPLHFAVREDRAEMVSFLISVGANPDLPNQDDESPRELAEMFGSSDVKIALSRRYTSSECMLGSHLDVSFGIKSPLLLQKSSKKSPSLEVNDRGVSNNPSLVHSHNAVWQGENSSSFPKRLTPTSNLPGGSFTGRHLINV